MKTKADELVSMIMDGAMSISDLRRTISIELGQAYKRGFDAARAEQPRCTASCPLAQSEPSSWPPLDGDTQVDFFDEKSSQWARL